MSRAHNFLALALGLAAMADSMPSVLDPLSRGCRSPAPEAPRDPAAIQADLDAAQARRDKKAAKRLAQQQARAQK